MTTAAAINKTKPTLRLKLAPSKPSPVPAKVVSDVVAMPATNKQLRAEKHAFFQKQRKMRRRAEATLGTLILLFPKCFTFDRPQPLKISIDQDIRSRATNISANDLHQALRIYVGSPTYLAATIEGAIRVNLDGEPDGIVTVAQAGFAQARLKPG
jgi:hypothetical protein